MSLVSPTTILVSVCVSPVQYISVTFHIYIIDVVVFAVYRRLWLILVSVFGLGPMVYKMSGGKWRLFPDNRHVYCCYAVLLLPLTSCVPSVAVRVIPYGYIESQ